jgi:phospholipid/cholesterol/gamma-HCH transport system permease protein
MNQPRVNRPAMSLTSALTLGRARLRHAAQAGWQVLLLAAELVVLVLHPATYRTPEQRHRLMRHLVVVSSPLVWPYLVATSLLGLVLIRIVVTTAAQYGLSQYALEVVVRTLVLELIPLGAALFVAVRSALPVAQAWRRQLVAMSRQGRAPTHAQLLMGELAPRAFALGFAVLLLCGLAGALMLVLSYLSVYGLSPWGWPFYTEAVGGVFTPAVTLIFLLKTLGMAVAVAVVPLAAGAWAHTQGEPLRRSDMAEFARLSVVLLLIEMASLVGNYY